MAHMLSVRQGKAEMAYVGKTPWHELGQQLAPGASIEQWAKAAGMAWTIGSAPVQFTVGDKTMTTDGRVVLYRDDTLADLGVVSTQYQPVPPTEVLEFFRDLTDAAGFQLETAGVLFGGKRLWALASIGSEAVIADARDRMKGYLLLSTACDGSMSTEARYTTVRVVCHNTLGFARDGRKANVKVNHRTTFDPAAVKRELGIETARSQFDDAMAEFRRLAETAVKPTAVIEATANLFVPAFATMDHADKVKLLEKVNGPVHRVGELALDHKAIGSDLDGTQGTAWGWLNAVTQYVDHEARARTQDTRLNSAWYGRGAEIKQRALEMAVEMVGTDGRTTTVYQPAAERQAVGSSLLDDVLANTPACA